jgi:hypothetical protein
VHALQQLGLSMQVYAVAVVSWDVAISLLFLVVGALIFWRKSAEWYGLFVSLLLVTFGFSGLDSSLVASVVPLPLAPFQLLSYLSWPAVGVFLVTFPTGRFRPRWTWVIALLWLIQLGEFALPSPYNIADWPGWLVGINHLVVFGSTAAVQLYRYRRVYTPLQRQQAKWLLFGVALGAVVVGLDWVTQAVVPGLNASDSPYQLLNVVSIGLEWMAIILALGVAILQYRLWDIDTIINRALVYGGLSALLGALFAGLILGLENLGEHVGGPAAHNPIVLVLSTLAIATLVLPVRRRLQALIDRRFYRQKYDAEQTLASFSATLGQEVDLESVRQHLVAVVQETMQPAQVSLWLRPREQRSAEQLERLEIQIERPSGVSARGNALPT